MYTMNLTLRLLAIVVVLRRWRTTLLLLLTVAISLFARTRDGTEEARLCVRDA